MPQSLKYPVRLPDGVIYWSPGSVEYPKDHPHSMQQGVIKNLRQQLAELERKLAEQQSQNNFDATRLRRLAVFCGVSAPESDEELLQVAGVVIGSCLRVFVLASFGKRT